MNNALTKTLTAGLMHGLKVDLLHLEGTPKFQRVKLSSSSHELKFLNGIRVIKERWVFHTRDKQIKPYLLPMSSLTKEIDFAGERFVPKEWLRINFIGESMGLNTASWSHRTIDKLTEWHFNVFELSPEEFIEVSQEHNPYK